MIELRNDCEKLLAHIKKCQIAMELDGYTDAGVIGYLIKIPFKKMHRYQFAKIEIYTSKINEYIKENEIDLNLEKFEELENVSMIYDPQQISTLGYRDYEHRIKYLENLNKMITHLLESSSWQDIEKNN